MVCQPLSHTIGNWFWRIKKNVFVDEGYALCNDIIIHINNS